MTPVFERAKSVYASGGGAATVTGDIRVCRQDSNMRFHRGVVPAEQLLF
jgi:hypothetical protein